jgi:hypothetical protein
MMKVLIPKGPSPSCRQVVMPKETFALTQAAGYDKRIGNGRIQKQENYNEAKYIYCHSSNHVALVFIFIS